MSENAKTEVKTIKGPKAAVASFIRPRDHSRIYVFCKKGESPEQAILRVKKHNGAEGVSHERVA